MINLTPNRLIIHAITENLSETNIMDVGIATECELEI